MLRFVTYDSFLFQAALLALNFFFKTENNIAEFVTAFFLDNAVPNIRCAQKLGKYYRKQFISPHGRIPKFGELWRCKLQRHSRP